MSKQWIYNGRVYKRLHGYTFIKVGDAWICEHRLVCEELLKRQLKKEESIHHIDFNKANNKVENLAVFKTHSEHMKFHTELRKYGYMTNPMKRRLDERRLLNLI